jgi:hypothetical protein
MITNAGKSILSKYLIGQSPSYASHIAIGCGANSIESSDDFGDYSEEESLKFEMFRVPILSRGYVTDKDGTSVALSAELPTEDRYEITEIGIFSSGTNPSAGSSDSKALFTITEGEGWEYHDQEAPRAIPVVTKGLNQNTLKPADIDFKIKTDTSVDEIMPTVFFANASNTVFESGERIKRNERCRFLDNMVMIRGDEGDIDGDLVENTTSSNHIHLTGINVPLDKNAPEDQIKLALSVINREEDAGNPDEVRIIMEFRSTESATTSAQFATFRTKITDFSDGRYFVITKQLQELQPSSINLTWSSIGVVKIVACVIKNGEKSDKWYVAIDGIRLENVSTKNPLYGMTGYSVVKTIGALPIVKESNTKAIVEFRFSVDVDVPGGES